MAIFYCGTEINILKFRYLLQIQLTTHTINSLQGLICPLYYRVTLETGLQQVKKLATPLSTVRRDCDMLMIVRGGRGVNMTFFLREYNMFIVLSSCLLYLIMLI